MRHRSTMGPRTARLSQGRPRHRPRFRRLLHVHPSRFLLGTLVSVVLAALFLAVTVVSGKVTDPPPAALLTPAPGAQSTAGSVVVMGEDGSPVLAGVPGATSAPSAAPTSAAATSTAASHAATAAARHSAEQATLAAGAAGRPVVGHSGGGTPATTGSASSSSRPSTGPTGAPGTGSGDPSATGSSAPPVLPTDTPPDTPPVTVSLPVSSPTPPSPGDPDPTPLVP